jgi:hypothetical protein
MHVTKTWEPIVCWLQNVGHETMCSNYLLEKLQIHLEADFAQAWLVAAQH